MTPQEQRVAELIAKGYEDSAIADELGIATSTVKTHISRIYMRLDLAKSGLNSRVLLTRYMLGAK